MSPTSRKAIGLLLLASLLFRLQFIAHDMRDLVSRGPLYDDSFYCFEIARNIAAGLGSTFDGVHPTNGYQPLYVLLLVPVYALCGGHATAPIYIALVGSALLNVLTGWILFRLLRRYTSLLAATFGLVLWGFGPAIVRQAVNGLETALAMFLIAASLEYYLTVFRASRTPSRRQAATLGLLLGLAVLARIDALLFVVALAADDVWRRRRQALGGLAIAAVFGAGVLLPWAFASQQLVGGVLPESGRATRYLSEAYAPHDHPILAESAWAEGVPPLFLLENAVRSLLQLGTSPVLQIYTRGTERLLRPLRLDSVRSLYGTAALLAVLLGLAIVFAVRRRRRGSGWIHDDFRFLFLYSVLLLGAYSFVVFGQIFYSRYYYPIFFFSILLGAFAFDVLLGLVERPRRRRLLAAALLTAYGLALPYMCMHRIQNGNYRFLHVVDWIAANTPPDASIGVFNSGAIGYFSDRHIVNLDGKVNAAALQALRAGRLPEYVEAQRLDYVIDHEWILGHFLLGDRDVVGTSHFARVDVESSLGVPGWSAYRIDRVASETVTGAPAVATRLHP